jgi:hypothetical protein
MIKPARHASVWGMDPYLNECDTAPRNPNPRIRCGTQIEDVSSKEIRGGNGSHGAASWKTSNDFSRRRALVNLNISVSVVIGFTTCSPQQAKFFLYMFDLKC